VLRTVSRGWLMLETGWVLLQAIVQWPRPEAHVWLMDLGFIFLVARTAERAPTVGRASLLAAGMFVWPPLLWAMATTTNRVCATHAWTMSEFAKYLIIVKVVLLFTAVGKRWWSQVTRRATDET
jgi:hypothetical protein